jgi:hypothetical protein
MKVQLQGPLRMFVYGALAVLVLCGQPARASLVFDLNCTFSDTTCDPLSPSQGTVTLDNSLIPGQIKVTVNLAFGGHFRDLMLNFKGAGINSISSSDGQVSLSPDGFSFPNYTGLFDIGSVDLGQHWNGANGYTTILSSGDGSLSLSMFNFLDSKSKVNVSIHIQDIPGVDSLQVGGTVEGG